MFQGLVFIYDISANYQVKNLFETKFYLNGACLADSNPDLMIIPQASLAGKQKQKNVQ
jgi:hypothetical protein